MMKKLIPVALTVLLLITSQAIGITVPPVPLADDNGDAAFVKQLVPKLLGRKPKGMLEVNLLADIAKLHGREAVVRALMESTAFNTHWTALLVDHLKTKRDSVGAQNSVCFNQAMVGPVLALGPDAAAGSVAEFVLNNDVQAQYPQDFNMYDLIKSSIKLDNLLPIYRTNLFVMGTPAMPTMMFSAGERRALLGSMFDDIYLNRNVECLSCHNGNYSTSGIGDRTHPLYKNLDLAMFDFNQGVFVQSEIVDPAYLDKCEKCHGVFGDGEGVIGGGILNVSKSKIESAIKDQPMMIADMVEVTDEQLNNIVEALSQGPFGTNNIVATKAQHFAVFREDFFSAADPEAGLGPWGISKDCASINIQASDGPIEGFFAGLSGDYLNPASIDEHLNTGYQALPASLAWLPADDNSNTIEGNVAYAYMLAAKITDNVWEQFFGERLTIVNQYARNAHQRSLHAYLTEEIFIKNDWSLKELIVAITKTGFFNRRTPAGSTASSPYELQAIAEPFVSAETCRIDYSRDDTPSDPAKKVLKAPGGGGGTGSDPLGPTNRSSGEPCRYNGQGDLVHRYAPRALLNFISVALDWAPPKIFPNAAYPSVSLSNAIGQYYSINDTGDKNVGFQGLLYWDGRMGMCPIAGDETDWLSKTRIGIDEFNKNNPENPLTLGELALTIKDWLIQEPALTAFKPAAKRINDYKAVESAPSGPVYSETELLEKLFGIPLEKQVDSSISEVNLRQLCGVYVKSPQFMMAGIVRNDPLTPPRYRVCNSGNCSYREMCLGFTSAFQRHGFDTVCNIDSVSKPLQLTNKKAN